MRVGVTCAIEYSVFSSGLTNVSLAIGELFKSLGHTVKLINIRGNKPWWDDCTPVQKIYDIIHLEDISGEIEKFDVVFEVAQLVLSASMRSKITNKSVWIVRKPFVLTEIESSIFPVTAFDRDLSGVSEAWLLDEVTAPDDITAFESSQSSLCMDTDSCRGPKQNYRCSPVERFCRFPLLYSYG